MSAFAGLFSSENATLSKVLESMYNLDASKATGLIPVAIKFLKYSAETLSMPLCHIMNSSFQTGIFPEVLKIAKVTPLFKGANSRKCPIIDLFLYYHLSPKSFEKQSVDC